MKRIFTILVTTVCLIICHIAKAQNMTQAQDDVFLISNPQNAKWSYIESDSKGKERATIYYSVESIKGDGMNGNIKLRLEEVPFASPNDTTTNHEFYRFKDGELMVDMIAGFEYSLFDDKDIDSLVCSTIKEKYPDLPEEKKEEVTEKVKCEIFKISGETRGIPRYPKVGKLPDYEFHFKISIINMKISCQDRRIVGTERIQTEAGEFDCFIMEETLTTKASFMKDVEKTKSWYAYGIGLVKEITYDKHGKLLSTMTLNKIN